MSFVMRQLQARTLTLAMLIATLFMATPAHGGSKEHASGLRLGTAAAPFGWSSAVADLDADEKPDFAIADRTSVTSQGYDYSIELGLSHETSQIFRFRSSDSALNLAIVDLDNDRDLDVVLTHAGSGEIAGVWINNGRGQFHEGNAADFLRVGAEIRHKAAIESKNIPVGVAELTLRKKQVLAAVPVRFGVPLTSLFASAASFQVAPTLGVSYQPPLPRAPPSLLYS